MSHQRSLCKCPGCPDRDTAACPYRKSENQVKELLVESKILRETWEKNARQNKGSTEQQLTTQAKTPASPTQEEIASILITGGFMSKVTFNDSTSVTREASSIPKGTFFTGNIGSYDETHFFKCYEGVISFPDGGTWIGGSPTVKNYCECDVDMIFKPIRLRQGEQPQTVA